MIKTIKIYLNKIKEEIEGQTILFTYDTSSRNYLFKSFYGDIENCKAKYQYFDI